MTYDRNNIFAKILRGEIPCEELYQDANVLAFRDILPVAPTHVLVVPKGEYISFDDFILKAGSEQVGAFFTAVRKIANDLGLAENGYRIITNHGSHAAQSVPHFHVHILGGRSLGGLLPRNHTDKVT